jgi:hypothetical protein
VLSEVFTIPGFVEGNRRLHLNDLRNSHT